MVKRSKGLMVNTRKVLRKSPKKRGKPPVTRYLQDFEIGDKASIILEPTSQRGQPHHRYQGRVGTVTEKRGNSFVVRIKTDKRHKDIIARPEHLRPLKE